MKHLLQYAFCILAFVGPAQIGYVDLTAPPPVVSKEEADTSLSAGCTNWGGGFADGFIKPDDGKKREITLEFTKISSTVLAQGSEFEAEVRLMNTGHHTIEIPWSTDPATAEAGPVPDHADYEVGEFEINLVNVSGSVIALKSLSSSLFGSKYSTGTERVIAPGQWITARIKTKMDAEYSFDLQSLTEGQAQLTAEWKQRGRYWSLNREKCEIWRGTFLYYNYYNQQSKPATITIKKEIPLDSQTQDARSKH
jgi:hypothetical protein